MRDNVYIRLGLPLIVVCALSAVGLAVTWSLTADRIEAQARQAESASLAAVLPDATSFERVADERVLEAARKAAGDVAVDGIFEASGGNGGVGVLVASRGYGGPIRIAVGVDRNGKVAGVKIVSMNETPGLGTKVVEVPAFLASFAGLASADDVHEVDTITGATKSSRGVRGGVEAAVAAYAAIQGTRGGGQQ